MIEVQGLSKVFKLYHSPADRLKEIISGRKYHRVFEALKDVSFRVEAGETLGVIGWNGAGKSTLLKLLTGILLPDAGTISIDGKITGLLELGTGFNAEFTGIQNIYLNGTLLGMSKSEIDDKLDAITSFSELGDFVNEPLKTYSSGMVMRLGFSIAIHADPKAFVVDEALSVGDAYFQQKCIRSLTEFRNAGGSIVLVTHDMNAVKMLCDSAMLMEGGSVADYGQPKDVVDLFHAMMLKRMHQGDVDLEIAKVDGKTLQRKSQVATGEVELISISILDSQDQAIAHIESENIVKIAMEIRSNKDLEEPHYGILIRNKFGLTVFETNTYCMNFRAKPLAKNTPITICFEMECPLFPGDYSITIGVANRGFGPGNFNEYLLLMNDAAILKVTKNTSSIVYGGMFNMNPQVYIT